MSSISLKIGTRVWQTSALMLVLFMLVLFAFISLCAWQISRAIEKEEIVRTTQQKALLEPKLISPSTLFSHTNYTQHIYTPQRISGNWFPQYTYLQDNVTYDGVAGYEVLTPFQALDGTVIMINRGWLEKNKYKTTHVAPSMNPATTSLTLEGLWVLPSKRFTLGEDIYPKEFPKIVQRIDHSIISAEINHPIAPLQLRLSQLPESSILSNHWVPVYGKPEKHYGYALQWFIFAIILSFLFIKLNLRPR